MTGSLIVGTYDLLDVSTPVWLTSDRDFGAPATDTATVARIFDDGDVVSGDRSGNREITLNIYVRTNSRAGDAAVVAALYRVVNQRAWSMTWRPEPSMPAVVFECSRGALTQNWSDQYGTDRVVTLVIPAAPFTRDAVPTVLTPPATPPAPIVLDALDSAGSISGLPAVPVANELAIHGAGQSDVREVMLYTEPGTFGDAIASTVDTDTTTAATGSGSVVVTQPIINYVSATTLQQYTFAPMTIADTFASAADLSAVQTLSWWAKGDPAVNTSSNTSCADVDATVIGIPAGQRDDPSLAGKIAFSGTWTVTLVDTSGRVATWVTLQPSSTSWRQFAQNIQQVPDYADSGFDLTQIASYRLRCYVVGVYGYTNRAESPEMYATKDPAASSTGSATLNCTASASQLFSDGYPNGLQATGRAAGTLEVSRDDTVAVAAGSTYSGRCVMRQHGGYATAGASPWNGALFQCGIDWLNSSGTVISTAWGSTAPASVTEYENNTGHIMQYQDLAEPSVTAAVAPAGSVDARIRYRMIPASGQSGVFLAESPRIVAGGTAWRYPYNYLGPADIVAASPGTSFWGVPTVQMWFNALVGAPAVGGVSLTGRFGVAAFPNVEGAARCPVGLAVTTSGGPASRLLIARTPNPSSQFTPFVSTSAGTPDSAALSGYNSLIAFPDGPATMTFTLPAAAYNSTYGLLVNCMLPSGIGAPTGLTVTAQLTGDTSVSETITMPIVGAFSDTVYSLRSSVGALTLPPRAVDPANTGQTIDLIVGLTGTAATYGALIDTLVLVDLAGEYVFQDGVSASRFWVDAPDVDNTAATLFAGTLGTRADAISCAPFQTGNDTIYFDPSIPTNGITVLADGPAVTGVQVGLTYSPRWIGERPSV